MLNCVFHIGFGKTGTSSLQGYLGRNPQLPALQKHQYITINKEGFVACGEIVKKQAMSSPFGYITSAPQLWSVPNLEAVGRRLKQIAQNRVLVLSQEDWARNGRQILETETLQKLGCRVHVIAYVRPQIEWFNSGWWQWWTWDDKFETPSDVLNTWGLGFMQWRANLDWWLKNPALERMTVRLHKGDTIADFLRVLGATQHPDKVDLPLNPSLAPLHIKLLKLAQGLRKPHTSQIDRVVQKFFPSSGQTPWGVNPEDMQRIVDGCREDNQRLMEILEPEQAIEMKADSRWWSLDPYAHHQLVTEDDLELSRIELSKFATSALKYLSEWIVQNRRQG